MSNLDNEIKKALTLKAENIELPPNLLNSIRIELEEKENDSMKRFKFTTKVLIASLALTVILASGVIAGGKIAFTTTSSSHFDDINHFPTLEEVENIVDYSPKFVEKLGTHKFKFANPSESKDIVDNGTHKFKLASPGESKDIDDNGNILNKYKDISFWYKTDNDGATLTLHTKPSSEVSNADKENSEIINYDGITLYYSSFTYKAVPPDYIKTDEDKELEDKGELMIGYGSDKIEEKKTQSIVWNEEGITYDLLDMNEEIDKSEFIEMAKQIIDVR